MIDIYRVTTPYLSAQATYNSASTGVFWANQGGDAVGTAGIQTVNPYSSFSLDLANGGTASWDISNLVSEWYQESIIISVYFLTKNRFDDLGSA